MEQRDISKPKAGYWAIRLRRDTPEVGAAIIARPYIVETDAPDAPMERSPHLEAFIDGRPVKVDQVWLRRGREITRNEYEYLVADSEWAKQNDPHDPKAQPDKAVDFATMKPVY